MKTQIIHLEIHDDLISARDKMSWSKAPRILLIWPRKGHILERSLDLVSLQRNAHILGAQLGIVSGSGEVRANARDLGIPVFATTTQAQRFTWRRSRGRKRFDLSQVAHKADVAGLRAMRAAFVPEPLETSWVRVGAFSLGVLAVLALVLFFLPSARLEMTPRRLEQSLVLDLRASQDIQKVNPSGGMPAYPVSVVVEGSDQLPSSGTVSIPDAAARGEVEFTNLTTAEILIPQGTVVTTLDNPPLRYATERDARLPAGSGRKAVAAVQALIPGLKGNVPAGKILAVEGPIGPQAGVSNPDPLLGGSDRASPAPSEQDYETLAQKMQQALRQTAEADLARDLKPGERLLSGAVQAGAVVKKSSDPQAGQPGDFARLTLQVEYRGWYVKESDLDAIATTALDANRPAGFTALPGNLSVDFTSDAVLEADGSAHWKAAARRSLESEWDKGVASRTVAGMMPKQAVLFLERKFSLAEPPQLTLWPSWWVRMPFLAFRIEVVRQ